MCAPSGHRLENREKFEENLRVAEERHRKFQDRRMMEAFPRATSSIGKWDYDDATIIRPIILSRTIKTAHFYHFPTSYANLIMGLARGACLSISAESQSWHRQLPLLQVNWHTGCALTIQSRCTESECIVFVRAYLLLLQG